jgi:hypothetical protein
LYDKKGSSYYRLGWRKSVISSTAAPQTVQCSNNRVFVIELFKIPNFTNVELTDMVLVYGAAGGNAVQAQILYRELFYLLLVIHTDNLIGPHILPNRLNGEEFFRFLSETLPELMDEVPLDIMKRMWYLHTANYPERWIGRNGPEL